MTGGADVRGLLTLTGLGIALISVATGVLIFTDYRYGLQAVYIRNRLRSLKRRPPP